MLQCSVQHVGVHVDVCWLCEMIKHAQKFAVLQLVYFHAPLVVGFPLYVVLFLSVYADILCRWSCDGHYFARMTPDTLSVYETPVSNLIYVITCFDIATFCRRRQCLLEYGLVYAGVFYSSQICLFPHDLHGC